MMHPVTGEEIIAALESNAGIIAGFFSGQPDEAIFTGDPEQWGPAHHLVHLTRTSSAIDQGLRSGALGLHSTGQSRPYAEVRDAANASLASTSRDRLLDMGRVVVVAPGTTARDLVEGFVQASAGLRSSASSWTEENLDRHAMKHPLVGELTVREMLLFCVLHEQHHLKIVRGRLEARQ